MDGVRTCLGQRVGEGVLHQRRGVRQGTEGVRSRGRAGKNGGCVGMHRSRGAGRLFRPLESALRRSFPLAGERGIALRILLGRFPRRLLGSHDGLSPVFRHRIAMNLLQPLFRGLDHPFGNVAFALGVIYQPVRAYVDGVHLGTLH